MDENEKTTDTSNEKTADTSPLATLWNNLAALIKVKTIVTLIVIGVFAALALTGKLQSDTVMAIVSMVVAFYFGTQTEKKQ